MKRDLYIEKNLHQIREMFSRFQIQQCYISYKVIILIHRKSSLSCKEHKRPFINTIFCALISKHYFNFTFDYIHSPLLSPSDLLE